MPKKITITFEIDTEQEEDGTEWVDYLSIRHLSTTGGISVEDVRMVIDYLQNSDDGAYDTVDDIKGCLTRHAERMEEMQAQQES